MEGRQQGPDTEARAPEGRGRRAREGTGAQVSDLKLGEEDVYIEGPRTGCQSLSEVRSVFIVGA